jgi:hypothetical protein
LFSLYLYFLLFCTELLPNSFGTNLVIIQCKIKENILGGNRQFDDLDSLCRDWYTARQCLNKYDRGSCEGEDNTNYSYQVAITVEPSTSEINNAFCNELHSSTSLPYNNCEVDSCKLDIHYVKLIREWMEVTSNFNPFKVVDGTSCPINSVINLDPKWCAGDAPDVYIATGFPPNTTALITTTEIPVIKEYGSTASGHLVFIVDRSSENNDTEYQSGIDFVVSVVDPLILGPNATVISIIGMSDVNNIYVTEASSKAEFDSVIAFIRTDQATVPDRDMSGAVDMASQLMGLRSIFGALLELTIVLITGGASSTSGEVIDTNTGQPINIYEEVHALNITVMSVGIGDKVNQTELAEVASDPILEFFVDVVTELIEIVERVTEVYVQVANHLPPTATAPPDPTTTMTTTTTLPYTKNFRPSTESTTTQASTSAITSTTSLAVSTAPDPGNPATTPTQSSTTATTSTATSTTSTTSTTTSTTSTATSTTSGSSTSGTSTTLQSTSTTTTFIPDRTSTASTTTDYSTTKTAYPTTSFAVSNPTPNPPTQP